ncbi:MAG TPA: response regulator transcription factor [Candidatus Angelobacter sp.]|nr:response regulator transcription factor [Candidatus Angelobacter sp.]
MIDKTARPRVVIADDHPQLVKQVAVFLQKEFDVVATANDGLSALEHVQRERPDAVLIDLYMPGMSGLDVVRILKASGARVGVVIMSGYSDPEIADAAIAAGAMGFIAKVRLADDLLPAMRGAVRGSVFPPSANA